MGNLAKLSKKGGNPSTVASFKTEPANGALLRTVVKHDSAVSYTKANIVVPEGFMEKANAFYFNPKGEGTKPFHVCGHISLVAESRSASHDNWGSVYEFQDHDGHVHRRAFAKSLLAGEGAEMRSIFLHHGLDIGSSREARTRFSELVAGMRTNARALAVDQIGWAKPVFVMYDRTIGDCSNQLVIYQGLRSLDHPYATAGTLEGWQNGVARYAVGNSRIAFALAAALVGPCLSPLGEESGGFHLRGSSSIGKSTALFVAGSAWGPETYVLPWRATSNGLEGACVQHNDTLLCFDEIAQLDPREAGAAAYTIANGKGKARANRSGLLRSSACWRVLFLSSGEISLSEHAGRDGRGTKRSAAGQDVRICDIPADSGSGFGLFDTLHDAPNGEALARRLKDGCRANHGIAGPAFIERIIPDIDQHMSDLKTAIDDWVTKNLPPKADGQVARVGRRFGLVAAVGELGIRTGVLNWPEGEAMKACSILFRDWLTSRGGLGSAEDRAAIARVRGYLEMHGGSRFESIDEDIDKRIINRAGFWRDLPDGRREYLFLAETWMSEVCSGMDSSLVAKVLARHKYLRQDSANKNSISIRLPAGIGKTRCYAVNSDIFEAESIG